MAWNVTPLADSMPAEFPQQVVSREALRSACQPLFEQMLQTLQHRLQEEQQQCTNNGVTVAFFPAVNQPNLLPFQQVLQRDQSLDQECTAFDAFAALLSSNSSDGEGTVGVESESMSPMTQDSMSTTDAAQTSEPEKSIMVCRHWKSKGFCRLGDSCRFAHPEHKRGDSVPKGGDNSKGCGMSRAMCPDISPFLSLSDVISQDDEMPAVACLRRRKRGGRNRSTKSQQGLLGNAEQAVLIPAFQGYSQEYPSLCSPCAAIV